MKRIKDILYLIGVLFSIGMVLFLSTAIVQLGTEALVKSLGLSLKDDFLFTISGGFGTAITGILCAFYVKKKNYTSCLEACEPFQIKKCAYYSAVAFFTCSVLFDAVTTFLFVYVFSMTDEIHVAAQKSWTDILLMDLLFPVLIAPVFEELLFRMGLYSLMRQRFEKKFSILSGKVYDRKEDEKKIHIIIADSGPKIPEDLRNTMFDSFVVGDDSRNTKNGSGLGLSISKKIIERHGGSLYYINDWKDGYKCFRIDL